ncbi:hypothetical protein ATANTOWER_017404 [Ataeniobius toweri]|uniref:Uncharacterized protein n=1 Tax=Ataeniobius toweri TaxID=208326 RepID=A0ABU7BZC2_9TELE|nr:hypothetical protein [Ataeniobius toweri]
MYFVFFYVVNVCNYLLLFFVLFLKARECTGRKKIQTCEHCHNNICDCVYDINVDDGNNQGSSISEDDGEMEEVFNTEEHTQLVEQKSQLGIQSEKTESVLASQVCSESSHVTMDSKIRQFEQGVSLTCEAAARGEREVDPASPLLPEVEMETFHEHNLSQGDQLTVQPPSENLLKRANSMQNVDLDSGVDFDLTLRNRKKFGFLEEKKPDKLKKK